MHFIILPSVLLPLAEKMTAPLSAKSVTEKIAKNLALSNIFSNINTSLLELPIKLVG